MNDDKIKYNVQSLDPEFYTEHLARKMVLHRTPNVIVNDIIIDNINKHDNNKFVAVIIVEARKSYADYVHDNGYRNIPTFDYEMYCITSDNTFIKSERMLIKGSWLNHPMDILFTSKYYQTEQPKKNGDYNMSKELKKIEELEETIQKAQTSIEELKEIQKKKERPYWLPEWLSVGDEYYILRGKDVARYNFEGDNPFHEAIFKRCEVFKSSEEAARYRECMITKIKLKSMADYHKPLPNNKGLSCIRYNRYHKQFEPTWSDEHDSEFAFKRSDDAQAAIDEIGQLALSNMRDAGIII